MPDGSKFVYENIQQNAEPTGDSIARENPHKGLSIGSASNNSIPQNTEKSTPDAKKLLENRVSGDDLLNAQDLIADVQELGGQVDEYGYITLYHRTSADKAAAIRSTGEMVAKENGLFFSTKQEGQNVGYGDTVVTFSIPAEKLLLDDIFDDEAHLRFPLDKPGRVSVQEYLVSEDAGDTGLHSDPEDDTHVPAFSEGAILTALWDAMDHKDAGYDELIRVSKMPHYVTEKFGIQGDLYIRRDHTYENMVSEAQAIEEGRPITRGGKKIHFHELGVDDMAEAMLSFENPIMTIQVPSKDGNPSVVMMLNKLGANGMPLYAVLSFYSANSINGRYDKKPHVVATISPRELTEQGNAQDRNGKGRQGWIEFINKAIQDKRVLDYDKKRGSVPPVIAQHARLGNITEASLKDSIARFRKEINDFKQKNKIFYSDPEDDVKSDREILAGALMSVAQNEIERNALKVYQGYVKQLDGFPVLPKAKQLHRRNLHGQTFRATCYIAGRPKLISFDRFTFLPSPAYCQWPPWHPPRRIRRSLPRSH